jgi:HlyD family secretion protein
VVTYNVVVSVENPEQKLLPGMTAYVNIAVAERKGVLKVPNAALRFKPSDAPKADTPKVDAAKDGNGSGKPGGGERKKRDSSQGTVWVLEGERLKPVGVSLGITDNRYTEVAAGELKAGDRVVTAENNGAASGKPAGGPPGRLF